MITFAPILVFMSMTLSDRELANRLKDELKKRGRSMKDVSESMSVPYRTVQNYLGGDTKIPATFFLGLCQELDIEADYFISLDFRPRYEELRDAVYAAVIECGSIEGYLAGPARNSEGKISVNGAAYLSLQHRLASAVRELYNTFREKAPTRAQANAKAESKSDTITR
jgi:transcriptional regulator with XRE-family HTH domain